MLYNAHFLPNVGRGISRVAEFKYKGAGTWKSVKLTEKYLIASTTGRHSHVSIVLLHYKQEIRADQNLVLPV